MNNLEKAIKGLECCTADLVEYHQDHFCDMYPYKSTNPRIIYCFNKRDLMADALSLLKAPEARVANLDELKLVTDDGPFYWMEVHERKAFFPALKIEERGAGRAGPLAIEFAAIFNSGYGPVTVCRFKTEEYNIVWRCWTSRPTDAQREATPWAK